MDETGSFNPRPVNENENFVLIKNEQSQLDESSQIHNNNQNSQTSDQNAKVQQEYELKLQQQTKKYKQDIERLVGLVKQNQIVIVK